MHDVSTRHSTRDRILAVAEELFAKHGFKGTSLRQLTEQAQVNLAAVNYHFGSKNNLITEVLRRRMDEMTRLRMERLDSAEKQTHDRLEAILHAFIEPALALSRDRTDGMTFVRMLARAYAERNESLHRFMVENYGHVLRRFSAAISDCLPRMDRDTLRWRMDFLSGALTLAMIDLGRQYEETDQPSGDACTQATDQLVMFAAAGLRAGVPFS